MGGLKKQKGVMEAIKKLPTHLRNRNWVSSAGITEIASSFSDETAKKIEKYVERVNDLEDDTG
jgi:hypothetical protein